MTSNEKEMLNTLRYLSRFNIGDDLEGRILKTLVKVGKCPHRFDFEKPFKCYFCNKTRKQLKEK